MNKLKESYPKNELFFYEYRPVNTIVGNNKNKINGILTQDYYLNSWKNKYNLSNDINGNKGEITIDNENYKELYNYAQLDYEILSDGVYFINHIVNKTKIPGLGVILINELKKQLKGGEKIQLINCAYNKKGEKMKTYYKKQGFVNNIFYTTYTKKENQSNYKKIIHNIFKKIINKS